MGTSSKASLAWGFYIPSDTLFALLQTLRNPPKSGEDSADKDKRCDDPADKPPQKKVKTNAGKGAPILGFHDASELGECIQDLLSRSGLSRIYAFYQSGIEYEGGGSVTGEIIFAFCYMDDDQDVDNDEYVKKSYQVERWGMENFGETCLPIGPTLKPIDLDEDDKEAFNELQDLLHFKQVGIEVEQQWILTGCLG